MPILQATGISKAYGSVKALSEVDLKVNEREIHAVLGENGAGKSTLVGVLSGFVKPDAGEVVIGGKPLPLGEPAEARKLHVELVHQHFMLVSNFSVIDNLLLSSIDKLSSGLSRRQVEEKTKEILEVVGWQIDLDAKVSTLPVGVRQRLEIIKALLRDAKILVLDEPTASLSAGEIDDLFKSLRKLRDNGTTIILIAHKLSEIIAIVERVTVLKQGEVVAVSNITDTNVEQLAAWMVGELPEALQAPAQKSFEPGLHVTDLLVPSSSALQVNVAELTVGKGEILGIGGVDGNGQVELAEALVGIRPYKGNVTANVLSPEVAYIPQDRQRDGLALSMSILDNLLITGFGARELVVKGWLKRGKVKSWANSLVKDFEIKIGRLSQPALSLSGGNQQKIVLARNLSKRVDLLVAVNPTRGLDLRATNFVHRKIVEAAKAGASVVLISSDLDDLGLLAHRTLFLSSGHLQEVEGAASLVGS